MDPEIDPNYSPLPTVNERLGHLKPSKELLEYYRRKIAEYDGEHEEMLKKMERYKCTYEEQVSLKNCFVFLRKILLKGPFLCQSLIEVFFKIYLCLL